MQTDIPARRRQDHPRPCVSQLSTYTLEDRHMTVLESVLEFISATKSTAKDFGFAKQVLFSGEMEEAYKHMVEAVRVEEASRHRYYGSTKIKKEYKAPTEIGGTIHDDGILDVESHNGKVVSVWFR